MYMISTGIIKLVSSLGTITPDKWDDSHVPCSCHRGSIAVGSHCL